MEVLHSSVPSRAVNCAKACRAPVRVEAQRELVRAVCDLAFDDAFAFPYVTFLRVMIGASSIKYVADSSLILDLNRPQSAPVNGGGGHDRHRRMP